jgi:uncharacterized protein (DUF58 family)
MSDTSRTRAENYLAPETLAQLMPFELRAKMVVEGVMSGMHRSPYQGMAVEFAEHRQYAPGDDLKHLDWKVFGRSDKLYVKRYQQETNLDVILMIDASASMRFGSMQIKTKWGGTEASKAAGKWTKFDSATAIGVALAHVCLHQQDRVGVVIFADEIRAMVKRSSAPGQWRRIVNTMSTHTVDAQTDIAKVTDQVLSKVTNRALFIIISDFFDSLESIRTSLARFRHRRHDVVLMQVLDRQELKFDFTQAAPFDGLEGEGRVQVDPRALRKAYLEAIESHIEAVGHVARQFGFDHVHLDSHDSVGPPLSYLLARRNAIQKRSKVG